MNEDSLLAIFRWLPIRNRISAESVCANWREIMPYWDLKKLNAADFLVEERCATSCWTFYVPSYHWMTPLNVLNPEVLEKVLQTILTRVGPYLQQISFSMESGSFKILVTPSALELLNRSCPRLQKIDFSAAILSLDALELISQPDCFPNLFDINVSSVRFTQNATQNQQLCKNWPAIQQYIDSFLENRTKLRRLILCDIPVLPEFRHTNSSLMVLNLNCCYGLNGSKLRKICQYVPVVEVLSLNNCLAVEEFGALSSLSKIQEIYLCNTKINNEDLKNLCSACPQMTRIDISECRLITNFAPLTKLRNLKDLKIGPSVNFRDIHVENLGSHGKMEKFGAIGCIELSDRSLFALGALCVAFSELKLSDSKVSNQGMKMLIAKCRKLHKLDLYSCTQLSNSTLETIGTLCDNLQVLQVEKCKLIDEKGYWRLLEGRRARIASGKILPRLEINHLKTVTHAFEAAAQCVLAEKGQLIAGLATTGVYLRGIC